MNIGRGISSSEQNKLIQMKFNNVYLNNGKIGD